MSFESFTRHCRGTVTSITFTFSFFLLLSLTNFPYQALTMMRPEDVLSQSRAGLGWAPSPCPATGLQDGVLLGDPTPTLSQGRPCLLTHPGFFCLDDSSDRLLHQPDLQTRQVASGPHLCSGPQQVAPGPCLCSGPHSRCLLMSAPIHRGPDRAHHLARVFLLFKNNSLKGKKKRAIPNT